MELRVHDLVRLASPEARLPQDAPPWAAASLRAAPWAVVRRAAPVAGLVAIGVRGSTRTERYGTLVPATAVVENLSPEDLARRAPPRPHPSFAALARLAPVLDAESLVWGPAGAAGYELAAGRPTLTETSDLDLVLRLESFAKIPALRRIAEAARATDAWVDVIVETPRGGVALGEVLGDSDEVMLRTAAGPRLARRAELAGVAAPC